MRWLIILLLGFFFVLSAPAAGQKWQAQELERLFLKAVKEKLPWVNGRIVLKRFLVEPQSLETPPGTIVKLRFHAAPRLGANTVLFVFEKAGQTVARARAIGVVEAEIPVLVAKRPLARGNILTEEDLTVELRPASRLPKDILTRKEEALGKRLKRSLRAGEILRSYAVETPPLIKRGALVRILAEGPGFIVSAVGEARADGHRGEIIKVRNLSSKKEVFAQVVDEKTVRVNF